MEDATIECTECDSPNGVPMGVTYTDSATDTLPLCPGCSIDYEEGEFVRDVVALDQVELDD